MLLGLVSIIFFMLKLMDCILLIGPGYILLRMYGIIRIHIMAHIPYSYSSKIISTVSFIIIIILYY